MHMQVEHVKAFAELMIKPKSLEQTNKQTNFNLYLTERGFFYIIIVIGL